MCLYLIYKQFINKIQINPPNVSIKHHNRLKLSLLISHILVLTCRQNVRCEVNDFCRSTMDQYAKGFNYVGIIAVEVIWMHRLFKLFIVSLFFIWGVSDVYIPFLYWSAHKSSCSFIWKYLNLEFI